MNIRFAVLRMTFVTLAAMAGAAHAAEIPLYETGPSEDSSFLRFVNASDSAVDVVAAGSNAKTTLNAARAATDYFPVKANAPIKGTLIGASTQAPVDVKVAPGEFATVFALAPGTDAIKPLVIREEPDDFNAAKVSLAFYSVDATCTQTTLQVAGRTVALFEQVPSGELKRRLINPVSLSVQLVCAGQPVGAPLALGELQAGARYSVFAVPGAQGTRLLFAADSLAR